MPVYDYQCEDCKECFEALVDYEDKDNAECPKCGKKLTRLMSAPRRITVRW